MKITKIEEIEHKNIFVVSKTPNFIGRLFGRKERQENYKLTLLEYHFFPGMGVYIDQTGKILGPMHKMTAILDNYQRAF